MTPQVLMVLESVFPAKGGGGAENQVRTLAMHLPTMGVPVSVLVPMVSYGPQRKSDSADGIAIRRITYPKVPLIGAAVMLFALAWRLYRIRHEYTFIHAHIAGNMSAVCCLMGRFLNKPVLIKLTGMTEMVGGILDPHCGLTTRLKKKILRLATGYQALSSQIAKRLIDSGFDAKKVKLIPNAVDVERFSNIKGNPAERLALCGNKRFVGVYVGRLEREKDLELMLQGWANAFRHRRDVALILVGSGNLRGELQAQAKAQGIEDQIIFVGPSTCVETYLALADVGLLTSRAEGLSNTLLEYMACGLPVIGTQVSGTEDFVIDGQTGWLFSVGDVVQLQKCLESAVNLDQNQLAALGRGAQNKVLCEASINAVIGQLIEIYKTPRIT
jgi:L-malate glycosyltransferase